MHKCLPSTTTAALTICHALQRVFDGQETQQFEDALQSYTNSLPEAGQSLARYGYCPHLAAQYKVSHC